MKKYKLKWYQWLCVPFLWVMWRYWPVPLRKASFHLVLKGIEPHNHNFNGESFYALGDKYVTCSHEGCGVVDIVERVNPV